MLVLLTKWCGENDMWYMNIIGKNKIIDYFFRKIVSKSIYYKLKKKLNGGGEYYIICRPHPAGFFSDFFYVLGHMIIADDMGLIPYVDMANWPSLYSEEVPINNTSNAWEYYFKQRALNNESKLCQKKYVICEEKYPYELVPYYSTTNLRTEGFPNKRKVTFLNKYIEKYIVINEGLLSDFKCLIDSMKIEDCVGVHIRGTDMNNTKGHNKPKSVEYMIDKINGMKKHRMIKKIFLCTDEENVREKMQKAFGGKIDIVYTEAYRSVDSSDGLHLESKPHTDRNFHRYNLGVEVLRDAYLLSKCYALICGKSNVAYAAIVLNDNKYDWIDCE